jgi:hypothetical protein
MISELNIDIYISVMGTTPFTPFVSGQDDLRAHRASSRELGSRWEGCTIPEIFLRPVERTCDLPDRKFLAAAASIGPTPKLLFQASDLTTENAEQE